MGLPMEASFEASVPCPEQKASQRRPHVEEQSPPARMLFLRTCTNQGSTSCGLWVTGEVFAKRNKNTGEDD